MKVEGRKMREEEGDEGGGGRGKGEKAVGTQQLFCQKGRRCVWFFFLELNIGNIDLGLHEYHVPSSSEEAIPGTFYSNRIKEAVNQDTLQNTLIGTRGR